MAMMAVTAALQAFLIVAGAFALLAAVLLAFDCLTSRYCDCGPGAHHPSCELRARRAA